MDISFDLVELFSGVATSRDRNGYRGKGWGVGACMYAVVEIASTMMEGTHAVAAQNTAYIYYTLFHSRP